MYDDDEIDALIERLQAVTEQIRITLQRLRDKDVHPLTVLIRVGMLAEEMLAIKRQSELDFLD